MIPYKRYINKNIGVLLGKSVLITGGNSGLGFALARYLVYKKATVYIACRNEKKAEEAIAKIKKDVPDANIIFLPYDQASVKDIKRFADQLINSDIKLDAIVFNAGLFNPKKKYSTKDNLPLTIGTNYFGTFALYTLLDDYISKHENIKLIFTSSFMSHFGKTDEIDTFLRKTYKSNTKQYSVSKFMLESFVNHELKKYDYKRQLMLVHPGVANTNVYCSDENAFPKFIKPMARVFLFIFANSKSLSSLEALNLISNDSYKAGSYLCPRGPFHIKGYPKKKSIPLKKTDENKENALIEASISLLNELLNN